MFKNRLHQYRFIFYLVLVLIFFMSFFFTLFSSYISFVLFCCYYYLLFGPIFRLIYEPTFRPNIGPSSGPMIAQISAHFCFLFEGQSAHTNKGRPNANLISCSFFSFFVGPHGSNFFSLDKMHG